MPRRGQNEAVSERASQILSEQSERRREAAQRGAQTRRQRREAAGAGVQDQAEPESPAQGRVGRSRRPRAHGEMMTVAIRGPLADKMRAMAEAHGVSLARVLQDALLVYEGAIAGGHEPGAALAGWGAENGEQAPEA